MWARKGQIAVWAASTAFLAATAANAGEVIEHKDLPSAVRQSIRALAPDMAPGDFQADRQGPDVYEIGYSHKGVHYLFTVDADGTVQRIQEKTIFKPLPPSIRNDRIADAASINQEIIEMALAGNDAGVAGKIADLEHSLPKLRPYLGDDIYGNAEALLKAMEAHDAKGELMGVSLAAVDAYRQLILSLDQTVMAAPIQVPMLKYSGFKLLVLSRAKRPDWSEIAATAREERDYWKSLAGQIMNSDLHHLMGSIQSGLDDGLARKDSAHVAFAARIDVNSVELLERYFLNDYKSGAGSVPPKPAMANG
jgi:hypothetical protein